MKGSYLEFQTMENFKKCKTFRKELERLKVNYITEEITRWQDCAKIKLYERPELTKFIYGIVA